MTPSLGESAIQRLGRYEITGTLGAGAMGVVYRARDLNLGRVVALKTLSTDLDVDEEIQTRFLREAEAIGRLSHPNIVAVYDLGNVEGRLFMAMELLHGLDLRAILSRRPLPPVAERIRLLIGIAEGVGYAHSRGVVHRDIKPANILVTAAGAVKILDFGLARLAASATITRRGVIMGTPDYMSPEQASGKPLDHRTDIFSTGAVFYELLTGQKPFKGPTLHSVLFAILSEAPPSILTLEPAVPARLAALVHQMLEKGPERRPATLVDLAAQLREIHAKVLGRSRSETLAGESWGDPESRARELVDSSRTLLASGDTRRALQAAHDALFLDPDSEAAVEASWTSSEARSAARVGSAQAIPAERIKDLIAEAPPTRSEDECRAALEQLVLLAPDEPDVESLLRARVERRRV